MPTKKKMLWLLPLLPFFITRGDDNTDISDWLWAELETPTEPVEVNPDIVNLGWANVKSTHGTLPGHINVYRSSETLEGKKATIYTVVNDMSKATFGVLGEKTGLKKPRELYEENNSTTVINGGFFYEGSLNLIWHNSETVCKNNDVTAEDWTNGPFWYPILAVFYEMNDGPFKSMWTYTTSSNITYWYSEPPPVKLEATPNENFPSTGTVLNAKIGMDGGPVLLLDGNIENTYEEEILSGIGATVNRPRLAIGTTNDKKTTLFVCEGDGVIMGVAGMITESVASTMKTLGCTDAINLNGGGSSCMLVNGQETIKTSDSSGDERSVALVVILK